MSILTTVKAFRTLLTVVLVAVWPLVTSHCDLEQLPGFTFLACTDEVAADAPHQESDCETDSCASVESGLYKTEDSQQVVPTPPLISSELLTTALVALPDLANAGPVFWDAVPPELSQRWQFSFRTALPPRAPSVVS